MIRLLEALPEPDSTTCSHRRNPARRANWRARRSLLDFADERSVVQTRFATTALACWRAHLGENARRGGRGRAPRARRDLPDRLVGAISSPSSAAGGPSAWRNEAALKLREASGSWTEAYPVMEFRHGPISVVDERSAVWIFGRAPAGLVDEITATGALVVQADIDPMADLVNAQRLAVALAERKGLDPDAPRHLTRSIILADR